MQVQILDLHVLRRVGQTRNAQWREVFTEQGCVRHVVIRLAGRELVTVGHDLAGSTGDPIVAGAAINAVVATTALSADPRGWDVTIYNPDLDPTRVHARRIVRFLGSVIEQASDLEAS